MVTRSGCSRPVAVREDGDGYQLERRRETVTADGGFTATRDLIHLDRVTGEMLEAEAAQAGLRLVEHATIAATEDYVASTVVILGA